MSESGLTIWTIGHSTRTFCGFLGLLTINAIEALADVRRFPYSRKHPHFNWARCETPYRIVGSSTYQCLNSAAVDGRVRIRTILPGAANHFVAMLTTWRRKVSARGGERLLRLAHRKTDGSDVLRGGLVAVSSVANRRLPEGGWNLCAAHHQWGEL